jgi:hypothetical protein
MTMRFWIAEPVGTRPEGAAAARHQLNGSEAVMNGWRERRIRRV